MERTLSRNAAAESLASARSTTSVTMRRTDGG